MEDYSFLLYILPRSIPLHPLHAGYRLSYGGISMTPAQTVDRHELWRNIQNIRSKKNKQSRNVGDDLSFRAASSQVFSAQVSLTSVFGMGTGGPSLWKSPTILLSLVKEQNVLLKSLFRDLCWHWPIFPGRFQPSIFGADELNFCVRNGNRWTLIVKNTNY